MAGKREQVFVGLFVIVAAGVSGWHGFCHLRRVRAHGQDLSCLLSVRGRARAGARRYVMREDRKWAASRGCASTRKIPRASTWFSACDTDLPVKTDSHARIMSMSPLGDNHLEILPGGAQTALAPPGSLLPSDTYVDFNALTAQINDLAPQVKELIQSLNDRASRVEGDDRPSE